jgi:hypothetical protein
VASRKIELADTTVLIGNDVGGKKMEIVSVLDEEMSAALAKKNNY